MSITASQFKRGHAATNALYDAVKELVAAGIAISGTERGRSAAIGVLGLLAQLVVDGKMDPREGA